MLQLRKNKWITASASFVLIGLFIFLSGGVQYLFLKQQYVIRKEIKKRIKQGVPQEELFVFSLKAIENDPSFEWEEDHEFHYKGSMYDIVKRNGDVLNCINDDQEAKLFADLGELTRKQTERNNEGKKILQFVFYTQYPDSYKFFTRFTFSCSYQAVFKAREGVLFSCYSPPDFV